MENKLIKKYFNIDRDGIPHEDQQKNIKIKKLMNLLKEDLLNLKTLKKIILIL